MRRWGAHVGGVGYLLLGVSLALACYVGDSEGDSSGSDSGADDTTSGVDDDSSSDSNASASSGPSASGSGPTSQGETSSTGADTTGDPSDTNADTSDEGPDPNDASQLCVDIINMYRATLNLPPYARWTSGEDCASDQAMSDSMTGQAHGAFGQCNESAQNECPGWPGPPEAMIGDCLALMWAEGPGEDFQMHGHYINMSSTNYSEVACGFYTTQGGDIWAIQNFR